VEFDSKDAPSGLALLVALACFLPDDALAQDDLRHKTWDVTLGAGAALLPTYQGSDRSYVAPVPLVSLTWRDTISLTTQGLSAYWHDGGLKIVRAVQAAGETEVPCQPGAGVFKNVENVAG